MAVIAATRVGGRLPVGDEFEVTLRMSANCGVSAADEWVVTGLRKVTKVIAMIPLGTAPSIPNAVLNARGTGVAENTNLGDLGIEGSGAAQFMITVRGRL